MGVHVPEATHEARRGSCWEELQKIVFPLRGSLICPSGKSIIFYLLRGNRKKIELVARPDVVQAHRGQTECDKCDTKLDSVGEYFTHRATHVAEKRRSVLYNKECPTCKKTFQSNSQHFKECVLRAKGEYIICDQCSFKTLFPASMRHHHAKFHGGEEPLKCSQCNWTTLTQVQPLIFFLEFII